MALTPRSAAPRRNVVERVGNFIETAPRVKQALLAAALAALCFACGVVVVSAALARPHAVSVAALAPVAAAAPIQPPEAAVSAPVAPVAASVSVTSLAPLPSASASVKPKKKHAAPVLVSRKPAIDDGF
jgi:hypothetical protein